MSTTNEPITLPTNPLLIGGRIPGSTFQMPSRGLFYTDGELEPGINEGEVHVFPMTTYDEILIKTPDLLFSGEAVDTIFKRCIPSILKPLRLLAKDVDFLLICLRSVSFGNNVPIVHTHTCKDAKEHPYTATIDNFIRQTKEIDPTTYSADYSIDMGDGKIAFLNPMRYDSVVHIMTSSIDDDPNITADEIHNEMVSRLASLINRVIISPQTQGNVDEVYVTDSTHIADWIKSLPIPQVTKLNNGIENLTEWGTDTSFTIECKDCKEEMNLTAPMNPMSFFT